MVLRNCTVSFETLMVEFEKKSISYSTTPCVCEWPVFTAVIAGPYAKGGGVTGVVTPLNLSEVKFSG